MSKTLDEMKREFERDSIPPSITEVNHNEAIESTKSKLKDAINPDHYKAGKMEAIEVMEAFSTQTELRGHLKLTALKYILRLGKKDDESQEIGKAIWYLNRLKETYKEQV